MRVSMYNCTCKWSLNEKKTLAKETLSSIWKGKSAVSRKHTNVRSWYRFSFLFTYMYVRHFKTVHLLVIAAATSLLMKWPWIMSGSGDTVSRLWRKCIGSDGHKTTVDVRHLAYMSFCRHPKFWDSISQLLDTDWSCVLLTSPALCLIIHWKLTAKFPRDGPRSNNVFQHSDNMGRRENRYAHTQNQNCVFKIGAPNDVYKGCFF